MARSRSPRSAKRRTPRRSRSQSPVRIPLTKGSLGEYGYAHITEMSPAARHRALAAAIYDENPLSVFRKLNALFVMNRNRHPETAAVFEADRDWVKRTYME